MSYKKYRIYCEVDGFETVVATSPPTVCPIDAGHTINANSVADVPIFIEPSLDSTKTVLVVDKDAVDGYTWEEPEKEAAFTKKYWIVKDVKSDGTNGGTFTKGSWQTRDLNTLEGDSDTSVTLSSNQITLTAGKYQIDATAPAYKVGFHQCRFRNITDSTTVIAGTSQRGTSSNTSISSLSGYIDITSTKVYELQHRCSTTNSGDGFGDASGFGESELYSVVKIIKVQTNT